MNRLDTLDTLAEMQAARALLDGFSRALRVLTKHCSTCGDIGRFIVPRWMCPEVTCGEALAPRHVCVSGLSAPCPLCQPEAWDRWKLEHEMSETP